MNPQAYTEMAAIQDHHWWFDARRQILHSQLANLDLPADACILEVGSGTGANLAMLARFGRVTGLEMNAQAIALASARGLEQPGRIELIQGCCPDDLPALGRRFNLVCMFDVLEHIPDDRAALNGLRDSLKPGGCLLLTIPAYRWLWSAHDEFLHHQRRYCSRELERLLVECGFVVRRTSYFNTLLFPLAAAGRIADRLLRRRIASGSGAPPPLLNSALRAVFASEQYLLARRKLPFGLSLLALASAAEGPA